MRLKMRLEIVFSIIFTVGHNESQEHVGLQKSPFYGNYTD